VCGCAQSFLFVCVRSTTRIDRFAECLKNTRQRQKGFGEQHIGKAFFAEYFFWALDTDFVECQSVLGKEKPPSRRRGDGDGVFAECLLIHLAKKVPLCRVSADQHLAKDPSADTFVSFFAECSLWHSTKRVSLPSVRANTLDKEAIPVPRYWYFAECYDPDTRQRPSLPSVTLGKVPSIHFFYLFFIFHPNKQKISYIHHKYHIYITNIITDITYTSHITQRP
jgi:hypothetical protein